MRKFIGILWIAGVATLFAGTKGVVENLFSGKIVGALMPSGYSLRVVQGRTLSLWKLKRLTAPYFSLQVQKRGHDRPPPPPIPRPKGAFESNSKSRLDTNDESWFIESALSRLKEKASPEQLKVIREKVVKWERTRREDDWIDVTDAIHSGAESTKSQSSVRIATSRGSGASIKYQTLGERKRGETPTTAKELTMLTEDMFIGMYHIWSERDGAPTSDKDAKFQIVGKKEKVTLQEKK